jgi:hypothetical protein
VKESQSLILFLFVFNQDLNAINLDDSKFSRQLKKLIKDEEEEKKLTTLTNLKEYLDKSDNLKVFFKKKIFVSILRTINILVYFETW